MIPEVLDWSVFFTWFTAGFMAGLSCYAATIYGRVIAGAVRDFGDV